MAIVVRAPFTVLSFSQPNKKILRNPPLSCRSTQSELIKEAVRVEYKPGVFDRLFLNLFRTKMVQEVGWDSQKPGYDGLIEVANGLMIARSNSETKEAAVRILRSLFPPLLLELYKMLIAPIGGGKVAAMMVGEFFIHALLLGTFNMFIFLSNEPNIVVISTQLIFSTLSLCIMYLEARVTALSCQWLMGTCTVNSVQLPSGSSWMSGVLVERCKYLEESKCVGICVNTCKLPTQAFFEDYMGVPLLMEPNFSDYSCQFKFGVFPPPPEDDSTLKESCLETCPNATRRKERSTYVEELKCPKA